MRNRWFMRASAEYEDLAGLDGIEDLDAYVAAFIEQERDKLAVARAAINAAMARHRAREHCELCELSPATSAERRRQRATAATRSSDGREAVHFLSKLPEG